MCSPMRFTRPAGVTQARGDGCETHGDAAQSHCSSAAGSCPRGHALGTPRGVAPTRSTGIELRRPAEQADELVVQGLVARVLAVRCMEATQQQALSSVTTCRQCPMHRKRRPATQAAKRRMHTIGAVDLAELLQVGDVVRLCFGHGCLSHRGSPAAMRWRRV